MKDIETYDTKKPLEHNLNVEEIKSAIRSVLIMDNFPDDKKVMIHVDFMNVPKSISFEISKK